MVSAALIQQPFEVPDELKSFHVLSVKNLSDTLFEICMAPSALHLYFQPGQYAKILCPDGKLRPFSVASKPNTEGLLSFHIRIKEGDELMRDHFDLGHRVFVAGPYGRCGFDFDSSMPALFLAEGVGIAAFTATLDMQTVSMVWVRNPSDESAYHSYLSGMKQIRSDALAYEKVLAELDKIQVDTRLYLAGSPQFSQCIQRYLQSRLDAPMFQFFSDV